jgi:hypothetical protein
MSTALAYVQYLDQIALAMKQAEFGHPRKNEIQVLPDRREGISLLPVIFEASQTEIVQLAGVRILDSLVSYWSDAELCRSTSQCFSMDSAQHKRVHSMLVSIPVQDFPKRSAAFFCSRQTSTQKLRWKGR